MLEIIDVSKEQLMSSREISELTGKDHGDVLKDIRRILEEVGIDGGKFSGIYLDSINREKPCFNLPRRECDLIIAGYSAKYRLAIIDRWQELENNNQFKIPTTLSGALRLAAEQADHIEQLEQQAKVDAPKVEFAMAVRNMEGACKIGDFSKVLKIGRNTLFSMLRRDSILMIGNMPYQKYIDAGWFVVIEQTPFTDSDGKAHPSFTTMVTGKGQVALERKYRAKEAMAD